VRRRTDGRMVVGTDKPCPFSMSMLGHLYRAQLQCLTKAKALSILTLISTIQFRSDGQELPKFEYETQTWVHSRFPLPMQGH
jgi:hypothetical protein